MNTKKRIALIALVSGLALVAVFSYRSFAKKEQPQVATLAPLGTNPLSKPDGGGAPITPSSPIVSSKPQFPLTGALSDSRYKRYRAKASSLSYEEEIFADAYNRHFKASEEELGSIQQLYSSIVNEKLVYEASIAKVKEIRPDGSRVIEIPAYKEVGDKMHATFINEVANIIGQGRMQEFNDKIGSSLGFSNLGWGSLAQDLTVNYSNYAGGYYLTHTLSENGSAVIESTTFIDPRKLDRYTLLKPLLPPSS